MSILIKGFNLPKNEDGTYFIPGDEKKGVEIGAVVMTLMIDQQTQELRMSLWNKDKYHLKESYPCIEIEPYDDLISRTDAIIDANERAGEFWLCDDEVNATIQFLKEQTAVIPAIEAAPNIEPKLGKWEKVDDLDGDCHYRCSFCGEEWFLNEGTPNENNMNYCPNCGAKMEMSGDECTD